MYINGNIFDESLKITKFNQSSIYSDFVLNLSLKVLNNE